MNTKKIEKKVYLPITALVLGLALFLIVPCSTVYAQSEAQPEAEPQQPLDGSRVKDLFEAMLVRTFRYQQSMVDLLSKALDRSDDASEKAQNRIAELEDDGKDTTVLQDALDQFYDLTTEADQALDEAGAQITQHAGFGETGEVENIQTARETVSAVQKNVRVAEEKILKAMRVINNAIQTFREKEVI